MLKLDHLTVIAPTLSEGVGHVRECLDLDVPFGTHHDYMGTYNHRLQLGNSIYLEIVAVDPEGQRPPFPRWFSLDNQEQIRADWHEGRRLRGWVANTENIDALIAAHGKVFGKKASLPPSQPTFEFSIPEDGSLPMDGAVPSLINHQGDFTYIASIPDLGARLQSFTLEHPNAAAIDFLYQKLSIEGRPLTLPARSTRYRALIETPSGLKELT